VTPGMHELLRGPAFRVQRWSCLVLLVLPLVLTWRPGNGSAQQPSSSSRDRMATERHTRALTANTKALVANTRAIEALTRASR